VSGGAYLGGLAVWLAATGSALACATVIARARLAALEPLPRALAAALLAIAALLAVYLLPGVLGVLSRGTVIAAGALLLAATLLWLRGEERRPLGAGVSLRLPRREELMEWAPAAIGIAVVAITVLAALIERAPTAVTNLDALNFHLPGVASWIQTGSYWEVNQYIPDLAHGNYPQNGDLLLTAAILPWHDDAFARLVGFPLLALAGLAVYALGRELGARPASAALWAAVFVSMPAVLQPATFEILTDTLLLATLACGLLFLLRHWRTGARADLLLAGLGLGIAFGTKWYGVSSVAVVLAVWAGAWLLARRPPRTLLRAAATLVAMVGAAGGFWLLRNLVESGNPLFPVRVAPLGLTLFDAPFDNARAAAGFSIAHYFDSPGVIVDDILPALWQTVGLAAILFGAAALAALALYAADRRRGRARDPRIAMLGVLALGLAAAYTVTPYTALGAEGNPIFAAFNVRYLAPALLAAAPLAAWLPSRLPALRFVWPGLGLLALLLACGRSLGELGRTPKLQAALLVAVAALLLLAGLRRGARLPLRTGWATAGVAVAVLALAAAGQWLQRHFNDSRYAGVDPVYTWVQADAPAGHRIGVVGDWGVTDISPVWPLFGPRLGNRVHYVGPFRREMLRDYRTRASFLAGLRRQRDDLLLVARGGPGRQERWASSAGLRAVVRSDRFTLYRVPRS
jgi:4-amino-4-deoxy-L-arabinose transferase-like glycosyltransferase